MRWYVILFFPISTTRKNTFAKKIGFRVSSIWHVRGIYLRMGIFIFGNSQTEYLLFFTFFLKKEVFFGCIDKNLRLQSRPLRQQTYNQIHFYSSKSFFTYSGEYLYTFLHVKYIRYKLH